MKVITTIIILIIAACATPLALIGAVARFIFDGIVAGMEVKEQVINWLYERSYLD